MAIYDPVHRRMVTFGGRGGDGYTWFNDVATLSLSGEPQWNALAPRGAPPEARWRATGIYDPVRNRMVVFGGGPRDFRADVWTLSLSSAPAWRELTTSGAGPGPRFSATAIYDPVRERMLVFGGSDGNGNCDDVWALSLRGEPEWSQILPAGPLPGGRYAHTAIYDPVHDRMVICGGIGPDFATQLSDTWALSLSGTPVWTELAPYRGEPGTTPLPGSRPPWRWGHVAIYDPARQRMVVFGGADPYSSRFDDVWALSLADSGAWTPLRPAGAAPPARFQAAAIYDPSADRMVVFGGDTGDAAGTPYASDVWALALSGTPAWSPLLPPGKPPNVRSWHPSILDPERGRMVVFGGSRADGSETEVWMFSLAGPPSWSRILPAGPSPQTRSLFTASYDPRRDRVVVVGGLSHTSPLSLAVWALPLSGTPSWTEITPTGPGPTARAAHTAIYDPEGDRMLVFGGMSGDGFKHYNDVWALSLSGTPTWTELRPAGASPGTRAFHSAIYDAPHKRMVILGGITGAGPQYLDDLWALSLSGSPSWTRLEPSGPAPPGPQWHSAIYDAARQRMVVFGGGSRGVWALSLGARLAWAELTPEGAGPGIRLHPAAIYDAPRDRMVVFGGNDAFVSHPSNDIWALNWGRRDAHDRAPQIESTPPLTAPLHLRPNPFRDRATLELAVASPGRVILTVHDVAGRAVRSLADAELPAGPHTFVWDGGDAAGRPVPSGIYFVRVSGWGTVLTEKVLLMR